MRAFVICGVLLLAAPLAAAPIASPKMQSKPLPAGPKIRVLLEKEAPSAYLEVKGSYRVVQRELNTVLSSGSVGKRFVVHALADGLRWGEEFPDIYQITVVPTSPKTCISVNGMQYKGNVSIFHVRDNQIAIVNEVAIEDFLKSTLALQYDDSELHPEALSAMTIAARTEAFARVAQRSTNRPWDVTAEQAQYYGCGVTQRRNGVEDAVEGTRYIVLNTPDQKVNLSVNKADELAHLGLDARKILQSAFPSQPLGITIDSDEVALHR